jgi:hypothetical protein
MKPKINPACFVMTLLLCTVTARITFANDSIEFEGLIETHELVDIGTPVEGVISLNIHINNTPLWCTV